MPYQGIPALAHHHDRLRLHPLLFLRLTQCPKRGVRNRENEVFVAMPAEVIDVVDVGLSGLVAGDWIPLAAIQSLGNGVLNGLRRGQHDDDERSGRSGLRPGAIGEKLLELGVGPLPGGAGVPKRLGEKEEQEQKRGHYNFNMPETTYRARRAWTTENAHVRVTVLAEGGHVAEIVGKDSGVNPLWTPPWPSIEPSVWNRDEYPEYGADAEAKLLAGIMGHNLCLDIFGGVSEEEAAAGLSVHGEASVAPYEIEGGESELTMRARFHESQLAFERRLRLDPERAVVEFIETLENLSACDRPVGWTQHVTLGPPFLENGSTQFRASATRSKVFESDFTNGKGYMKIGAEFEWPYVPCVDQTQADMRTFTRLPVSGAFSTHLMDVERANAYFTAWSPESRVAFGYVWRREDFPWLGIWEENRSRASNPWNGKTVARGMEFGASPMPETRRQMVERGSMFGVPGFRWIPAKGRVEARYCAALAVLPVSPEGLEWSEEGGVRFV